MDAELLLRALDRTLIVEDVLRVETQAEMRAALDGSWNMVISDYALPTFGAAAALATLQASGKDIPFIIVSGTVNEQIAVELMRAGAHDFLSKNNLARLAPAIERELRDAAARAERAEMQERLLISDRMVSLGTLAAGVAHEINNPLAAAMANLHFAMEDLEKLSRESQASGDAVAMARRVDALRGTLGDALESTNRVRDIVRDLRVFSRADEETTGSVDVHRVLESSVRMAWNEVRHRAHLVKNYDVVPRVHGNEGRLGQVFLNLIVNAAQAIPEGQREGNAIRLTTRCEGKSHVVVEVTDTGSGMTPTTIARIFDPFFTTKPIGQGTGLGLAICHRIVTAFGGKLTVDSAPGRGSTFAVTLRVDDGPPVARSAPPLAATRRGRVLVVDDEVSLGGIIRRMLAPDHEVVAVTSALDALQLLDHGERFDVILCDLMMPDVTGMDLHAALVARDPKLAECLVFMTGGAFSPRAREFLDESQRPVIEKPFDADALRAAIQQTLR
jgi:signal transduction histidine kinase